MKIPQFEKLWDEATIDKLVEGSILKEDSTLRTLALQSPLVELFISNKFDIISLKYNKLLLNVNNIDSWVGRYIYDLFLQKDKKRIDKYFTNCTTDNVHILNSVSLKKQFCNLKQDIILSGKMICRDSIIEGYLVSFYSSAHLNNENSARSSIIENYFLKTYEDDMDELGLFLRDDVAQHLFAIRMMLQKSLSEQVNHEEIKVIKKSLTDTIKKLLITSERLRPSVLLDFGIIKSIEGLIVNLKRVGFQVQYTIEKHIQLESRDMQRCIFRIVQLIVEHWQQHNLSSNVWLSIRCKAKIVYILAEEIKTKQGLACVEMSNKLMSNIKNRILVFNGKIDMHSTIKSCQIVIKMNSSTKKV